MHRSGFIGRGAGLLLGAALVLPPPGTDARGRAFCRSWLDLSRSEQEAVLLAAEAREALGTDRACRARLRPSLHARVDAECRNWKLLMDFEVRAIVDGVLEQCRVE